jgi:hypothetical protein
MIIQGQVGPIAQSATPGTNPPLRQGQLGDMVVSELHGRYYEQAYRRNLFSGALSGAAGVTASALGIVTATAYTGLVLYNPPGSTVNCVLQKVGYVLPIAPAAATVVSIGTGFSALPPQTTTAITARNNYVNGPAPLASLYSVATFGISTTAPVTTYPVYTMGWVGTVAATSSGQVNSGLVDLEGSIVIPPTGYACIYLSTAANTNGFFGSMAWEEVPV